VSARTEDLARWMERYQCADPLAPGALIDVLSPALLRMFRCLGAPPDQAEDLLQDTWLRIHRSRHSYRSGEPVLPWIYAIARRVRVDHYRRNRWVLSHELSIEPLPEPAVRLELLDPPTSFETLVAALPAGEREIVTLLKVSDMSVLEVARATSSTVGAVKQKAHRAYRRLRKLLQKDSLAGQRASGQR
jgi:RNA polymerase sigma-70 factor, ECF subfamily